MRPGGSVFCGSALLIATCLASATSTSASATATSCPTARPVLVNGGFEEPVVNPGFPRTVPATDVPGWTSTELNMEIWPPGVAEGPPSGGGGYTAVEGSQFIEVNAQGLATIYQDVETGPRLVLLVEAYHRGRTDPNTAAVAAGPPGGPFAFRAEMTDPPEAWGRYDWAIHIPADQPVTRLALAPLTGSGTDDSIGNLLDGVRVQAAGCLTAKMTATTVGAHRPPQVGGAIEYRIRTRNTGPTAITLPVIRDVVAQGTKYLAGSLRLLNGPQRGPLTDAADADRGRVRNGRVRVDAGTSAGDQLAPGASVAVAFRVQVLPSAAGKQIDDHAHVSYRLLDLAHTIVLERQRARTNTTRSPLVPGTPSPTPGDSTTPGDPTVPIGPSKHLPDDAALTGWSWWTVLGL